MPKERRPAGNRPSQGTTVFVCNDSQYLYIGFNCEDDASTARLVSRSNAVRYDGLWPSGEDLLEVIIDPSGRAVASGEILHILLKMNGVVVSEHSAACLQQVTQVTPWAAEVIAAVGEAAADGRWMAELRVPLSSLGALAPSWGINFGRYNARLGEYSSWSGARRYLYSPVTLGNIRLSP